MKISKLFHWLYALVMLLPIFAIGVTCGYAMFNKNAYKSYDTTNEISLKNVINTSSMIEGKQYLMSGYNNISSGASNYYGFSSLQTNLQQYFVGIDPLTNFGIWIHVNGSARFTTYQNDTKIYSNTLFTYDTLPDVLFTSNGLTIQSWGTTINPNYKLYIYVNSALPISNVFYYAVDKVTESPLFSWAYNSFLSQPLLYIVSLFSMPTNHVVVELLSYWLAISIIWLVFDLVMYVPLLVHRWIDKGVLE